MENIVDQIVKIVIWAGVGFLVLFTCAFWLFHVLKAENERRDKLEAESKKDNDA